MSGVTRRQVLQGGSAILAGGTVLWRQPAIAGSPAPEQLHLQFGADAARSMTVSWVTPGSVRRPRVRFGPTHEVRDVTVGARTETYRDAASKIEVQTHHAVLPGLNPDTDYVYEVLHDGAAPVRSTFKTAPAGREKIRFTSFGDQTTGDPRDPISTPFASYV